MSERDAFMRAICDNPDDDTPRLVFADWLQEHGENDRGEFIRAQVRFAELLRYGSPDADGLARRASELWRQNGQKWRAELPAAKALTWHDAFYRGFPERATVAGDAALVRHADAVFGQPIRQLVVTLFKGAPGFSELRDLGRLKTLTLINRRPTPECLGELLRCAWLPESVMVSCYFGRDGSQFVHDLRRAFGSRLHTLGTYSLPRK